MTKNKITPVQFFEHLDSIYADYEGDMIRAVSDPHLTEKTVNKSITRFQKICKAIEVLKKFNPKH